MVTAQRYTPVDRDAAARDIVAAGQIRRNGTGYYVKSQSQPHTEYWTDGRTRCTCPDFQRREPQGGCKHMRAVQVHLEAQGARRCSHCGHVGDDVVETQAYTGGRGYGTVVQCQDRVACWHRWDVQHGLAS